MCSVQELFTKLVTDDNRLNEPLTPTVSATFDIAYKHQSDVTYTVNSL